MKILTSYSKMARSLYTEDEDDRYVSIGFGRFKEKGKEDDKNAPTFTKDDSGRYVPSKKADSGGEKGPSKEPEGGGEKEPSKGPEGGEEKPKPTGIALGADDFERDFDDSEPKDKPVDGDTGRDADSGKPEGGKAKDIANKILSFSDDPEAESYPLDDLGDPEGFAEAMTDGPDAEELQKRLGSGEDGNYVQTEEMGGYVVFNNGDVYQVYSDQGGDTWVGKTDDVAKVEAEKTQDKIEYVKRSIKHAKQNPDSKYVDDPKELEKELDSLKAKLSSLSKQMKGDTGKDESIMINGQKYRPIKESKKPNPHILKENYDRIFRSRK